MSPRKKPTQGQLVKKADVLFSKIVRARGFCESGRSEHAGALQCAHGFSRRYRNVRWDARQCWALCQGCHVYYTHRPIEWDLWMQERMGLEIYEEVRTTALDKWSKPDVSAILERLRGEWAAIEQAAA